MLVQRPPILTHKVERPLHMNQDIKDEALEELQLEIKFGFENEQQLFDRIRDMFYKETDFDEGWLRQTLASEYRRHQQESRHWVRPTGFDKLAAAFDELAEQKIVCLHYAGHTKSDGESDCMDTILLLEKQGIHAIGFCYYHRQDLGRAVDPASSNLFLGFDSTSQNDTEALAVAAKIIAVLRAKGFTISWPGTVDQRIEINYIQWQKIPDKQDWTPERVIKIMTQPKLNKKPFWRFW